MSKTITQYAQGLNAFAHIASFICLTILIPPLLSGWLDFSEEREQNEKNLFDVVENMMSKLQSTDGHEGEKPNMCK